MKEGDVTLNKETVDILVANIIPTTKYFESRFDFMQHQINEIKENMDKFQTDVDRRFIEVKEDIDNFKKEVDRRFIEVKEDIDNFKKEVDRRFIEVKEDIDNFKKEVDRRFDEVNKKFEEIDKRFEKVDKRFEKIENTLEKMNANIHNLTLKIEELSKIQETTIRDYIIERDRYYDRKFTNLRNFNIAIITLVTGVILKLLGIIKFGG